MAILALKLILTPVLIGLASLVGRRWGPAVGGWLVGLPLTSGPVAMFLAIDHGTAFAASAASGSLVGAAAEAGFCLGYVAAKGQGWPLALAGGTIGFALASIALQPTLGLPLWTLLLVAIGVLLATTRALPDGAAGPRAVAAPGWDLPARMVVGGSIVVTLTAVAPVLGPHLSGIAATFPVFAGVLAVFADRVQGRQAAIQVLRGLLYGLFSFAAFFFVLGSSIQALGIGLAFSLAIVSALAVQATSLRVLRRPVEEQATIVSDLALRAPKG